MYTPIPRARLPHPDLQPLQHMRRLLLVPRESDAMRNQKIMIGVIVGVAIFVFLAVLIFILNKYHGTIRFSRNSRGTSRQSRSYYYGSSSRYSGSSSKGSHTSAEGKHGGPPPPPPPPPPPV